MAISSIEYTEYGQQYLTLPLTIKNVTGGLIVVNKVSMVNLFTGDNTIFNEDFVLTINETYSDYSEATQLGLSEHVVIHGNNQSQPNKTFKVGWIFSLESSSSFTFQTVFNPNILKNRINRGNFNGEIRIEFSSNGVLQPSVNLSVNAVCSDKEITLFSGVEYSSVNKVFGVSVGNVRNLN
tara:strand:- start:1185 stop:1727 length:543 start_codon:yes stop_codon:yes gene_type:complete